MIACPHIDNLKLSTFKTCHARKKKASKANPGCNLQLSGFWKDLQVCKDCEYPRECAEWRIDG